MKDGPFPAESFPSGDFSMQKDPQTGRMLRFGGPLDSVENIDLGFQSTRLLRKGAFCFVGDYFFSCQRTFLPMSSKATPPGWAAMHSSKLAFLHSISPERTTST